MIWNPWKRIRELEEAVNLFSESTVYAFSLVSARENALRKIAALETPNGSHASKKMARIANQALED